MYQAIMWSIHSRGSIFLCRAPGEGFRGLEALQRLNAYKDGVLKGYMGDSQTLFEEL